MNWYQSERPFSEEEGMFHLRLFSKEIYLRGNAPYADSTLVQRVRHLLSIFFSIIIVFLMYVVSRL